MKGSVAICLLLVGLVGVYSQQHQEYSSEVGASSISEKSYLSQLQFNDENVKQNQLKYEFGTYDSDGLENMRQKRLDPSKKPLFPNRPQERRITPEGAIRPRTRPVTEEDRLAAERVRNNQQRNRN